MICEEQNIILMLFHSNIFLFVCVCVCVCVCVFFLRDVCLFLSFLQLSVQK